MVTTRTSWPRATEKPGEVRAVCRRTADVRRPDSCEKCDAHAAPPAPRTGPVRPIIEASMPSLPSRALRRSARDPFLLVFLVTVVLCLLRARDLPTIEVSGAAVGFPDVALLVLAVCWPLRLRKGGWRCPRPGSSAWRGIRAADRGLLARQRRNGVHVGGQARRALRAHLCSGCRSSTRRSGSRRW